MTGMALLAGLLAAAFLAATPLPLQSEPVFVAAQLEGSVALWLLILAAGAANTAGSAVTYALGRGARRLQGRFAPRAADLARAERWFTRWGRPALLLSWAPLGDVICLTAGVMRVPMWQFLVLVGLAKTARYGVLAALTAGVASRLWT